MNSLEQWKRKNIEYYKDIERLYKFFIPEGSKVLELGSGLGDLLNFVNPVFGLGIDSNELAVEISRNKFPELEFQLQPAELFQCDKVFDYIILSNTISYLENIQQSLLNIYQVSKPSTKLIITFHNNGWELILRLATVFKQRMPIETLNWLDYEDVRNLLELGGFEVILHGKQLLCPRRIPFIFKIFNQFLAPLPIVNNFCLTEYIVAKPKPNNIVGKKESQLTCSVIVPARNESGNIENCIARMPNLGKHTEVIFIEGNSTDNTWDVIQQVQEKYGTHWDIKIDRQKGKGKGDAVRQGFKMASGDILMILDSDLTVKPEDLIFFFDAIASGNCEFANGCRLIYPIDPKAMPWLNKIANRFFARLLSYLLNIKIKDSLCGTKGLLKRDYLQIENNRSYFGDFDPFGDFDLLFGAAKLGLKIQDIPVRYVPRTYGASNIHHFKEGLILLKMCFYAAKKIKFRKYSW